MRIFWEAFSSVPKAHKKVRPLSCPPPPRGGGKSRVELAGPSKRPPGQPGPTPSPSGVVTHIYAPGAANDFGGGGGVGTLQISPLNNGIARTICRGMPGCRCFPQTKCQNKAPNISVEHKMRHIFILDSRWPVIEIRRSLNGRRMSLFVFFAPSSIGGAHGESMLCVKCE